MTEQKQELNMKLAEWRFPNAQVYIPRVPIEVRVRIGGQTTQYDFFTESLDTCFKELVPKLQDKGYNVELYAYEHKGYRATIYKEVFSQRGSDGLDPWLEPISQIDDESPALALCLAISKLIDKEGNADDRAGTD